jgi:hypothetical protein
MSLLADGRIAYRLRKPRKNGATHLVLVLEPVQLLARLSALIPPPRFALTRFAGVLAPSSTWRADVVACRRATPSKPEAARKPKAKRKKKSKQKGATKVDPEPAARAPRTALGAGLIDAMHVRRTRIDWASLLRRIYLEDVLACPCGGRRRLVAAIDEPSAIVAVLEHLGLPTEAPPVARARSPSFEPA